MISESRIAAAWAPALVAVGIVSLISLVGALTLVLRERTLRRLLILMVAFAAGALLGNALLHLLPAIAETGFDHLASFSVLAGVLAFFVLEKALHWHHAHMPRAEVIHPMAVTILVGGGLHNLVDGAIVAGAFLSSPRLGLATTVAVALHEIPRELGDFGILVHAGLKPRRALALNLASALTAVAGAVATLLAASVLGSLTRVLLPVTAGGFLYIASTDLLPELHREPEPGKSAVQLVALLAGVGVMAALLAGE